MSCIVVIDDQTTSRRIISKLASTIEVNAQVVEFGDPVHALSFFEENTPDLVITDYSMPIINGAEFVRRFRGMPECCDVPIVVVTHQVPKDWVDAHPDAPFSFVTDGVQAAIAKAQELAGDKVVAVTGGTIARQCLDLGLLDEVAIDLVPVVMGRGRPFFGDLSPADRPLGDPTACVQGDRVTHLLFPAGDLTR